MIKEGKETTKEFLRRKWNEGGKPQQLQIKIDFDKMKQALVIEFAKPVQTMILPYADAKTFAMVMLNKLGEIT